MNKNIFTMHIMWYEYKMVPEALDSIQNALQYSKNPPEIRICLNEQTYLETPIKGTPRKMFDEIKDHPIIKQANVIRKTDNDDFYNIGDWRREQYEFDAKYTTWGESDCILPYDFFYIIENVDINFPHILSVSTRKMWDYTWKEIEFIGLDKYDYSDMDDTCPSELRFNGITLTQEMLDKINDEQSGPEIVPLKRIKFDGALTCFSGGLPHPFIAPGQHITHEDLCAMIFFQRHGIPQFVIKNRMRSHNGFHKLKRTNTIDTKMIGYRSDDKFTQIANDSKLAMEKFLQIKIF
jgi:hypothetical protein